MRLVVYGGRDYRDTETAFATLDHLHARLGVDIVIHGAAPGADSIAGRWAGARGIPCHPFPARWDDLKAPGAIIRTSRWGKPYNAAAGHARNQEMIDVGELTHALEFPGGAGTADMRKRVDRAGLIRFVVYEMPQKV